MLVKRTNHSQYPGKGSEKKIAPRAIVQADIFRMLVDVVQRGGRVTFTSGLGL